MDYALELRKRGIEYREEGGKVAVKVFDYEFYVEDNKVVMPIELPKGTETLDDLIVLGTWFARASRLTQVLGAPVRYELQGSRVNVVKEFDSEDLLWEKLLKALDSIETLRYFL